MKRGNKRIQQDRCSAAITEIREKLAAADLDKVQYLELKQMNDDILPRYRNRVRGLLNEYRSWQKQYSHEEDQIEKIYKAYEGIFLRSQLNDALRIYEVANKDYHEMRRMYLGSLKARSGWQKRSAA
jgi:hypothetical protein